MDGWSKEKLSKIIVDEFRNFHARAKEIENSIEVSLQKDLDYLRQLILQAIDTNSAPLLLKTPRVTRGKLARRIETIHEDEATDFDPVSTNSTIALDDEEVQKVKNENEVSGIRRSNRNASRKASKSIRSQGSNEAKRPSFNENSKNSKNKNKTESKKRHKQSVALSSSDDEETKPVKQKTFSKKSSLNKNTAGGTEDPIINDETFVVGSTSNAEPKNNKERSSTVKRKFDVTRSPSPCHSNKLRTSHSNGPVAKKAHMIDDTLEKPNDTLEASVYEDAIGKPAPIHNSTKIGDLTITVETKLPESAKPLNNASWGNMNATVTLEPLSTTTIKAHLKSTVAISEDEDEVSCTPKGKVQTINTLLSDNRPIGSKLVHKPNALFSPYATDSVKKRVEAFEQVHLNSPQSVDVDAPVRVTRTKTRAMAAATAVVSSVQPATSVSNVVQKLARKSLAKAKKISIAKHVREQEDDNKENGTLNSASKPSRIVTYNEKLMQKQQLRITPNPRTRLQPPVSVGRGQTTPSNVQLLSNLQHTKAISGSRGNIVVNMESFLQTTKQTHKTNSSENREEIKRKATDDDARKKKDEALKATSEEKRRKREEKELKNRLAREAKEKLDMEKRLRAEKEREEKAKAALQMQEKQREEAERKRLLQLQRAQEKEERRKQEEELRLQQLQEQEETERLLADQRRKEQEAEKQHQRRLAEAKAQQRAAAEAARIKALNQAKLQGKQMNNTYDISKPVDGPTSYKMDSEPDDGSDDESAPKHEIPRWARPEVRRKQLQLQEYIPMIEVYKFFGSRQCTPDLSEMFQGIDKRRLIRTSSAIWKKPPRASMLYLEKSP